VLLGVLLNQLVTILLRKAVQQPLNWDLVFRGEVVLNSLFVEDDLGRDRVDERPKVPPVKRRVLVRGKTERTGREGLSYRTSTWFRMAKKSCMRFKKVLKEDVPTKD